MANTHVHSPFRHLRADSQAYDHISHPEVELANPDKGTCPREFYSHLEGTGRKINTNWPFWAPQRALFPLNNEFFSPLNNILLLVDVGFMKFHITVLFVKKEDNLK